MAAAALVVGCIVIVSLAADVQWRVGACPVGTAFPRHALCSLLCHAVRRL